MKPEVRLKLNGYRTVKMKSNNWNNMKLVIDY